MFKLYEEKEKTRAELENLKTVHSSLLEGSKQPAVSTVKYEGKLPVELDPEPILKILEKLPKIAAPASKPIDKDRMKGDSAKDFLKKLYNDTLNRVKQYNPPRLLKKLKS
jgi:predicted RNase H-like nuclease